MSVTPFDHPWLSGLLGDDEVAAHLTPAAELSAMLQFETALASAEAAEGVIPAASADAIGAALRVFRPDDAAVNAAAARDGTVGPELVRRLRAAAGPLGEHLHFGATSQDLVDTALVLRLRPVAAILKTRLDGIAADLAGLAIRLGGNRMTGRTRMQDALPLRAVDKIATWRAPLLRHLERLDELLPRLLVLQFGGAVGTLERLGGKGRAVSERLAQGLDLGLPESSWHSQRDSFAEVAGWLSLVSGSLGKIGADIGLLAQMGEITLSGGGTSSAMPHKQNPVAAEVLVTLAAHNAALVSSMHRALVHEQERSGSAWMLEWLTLPQMLVATGAGLRTGRALLAGIADIGTAA